MPKSTNKEALRRIKTTIFNERLQMMDVKPEHILRRGVYGMKAIGALMILDKGQSGCGEATLI